MYPNPVIDVLYMKSIPFETVDYSIFNVLGQKVASGTSNGSIPVAGLGKGVFVLQVRCDKYPETTKFVVR